MVLRRNDDPPGLAVPERETGAVAPAAELAGDPGDDRFPVAAQQVSTCRFLLDLFAHCGNLGRAVVAQQRVQPSQLRFGKLVEPGVAELFER
jgi:hypothetical protein